jgi:methylthioribose-1-phosphate isomerase
MQSGKADEMQEECTISWDDRTGSVILIDQTLLPETYKVISCHNVPCLVDAIRRLAVRGAPALGVAGGYGVALAAHSVHEIRFDRYRKEVHDLADIIRNARPTAVNLAWGVDRVLRVIDPAGSVDEARNLALAEAKKIADEDIASCRQIGEIGAALLPDRCTVLTHCNAGALACTAWGTALGVVRTAVQQGKEVKVIACETRPLLQGARLTAWELTRDTIDVRVITDSSAAFLMRREGIDIVLVGADRITPDAVFNKIGTYMHAICARYHAIPFYVAAPLCTFDLAHKEPDIPIEERGRDELSRCGDRVMIPEKAGVLNYAFDITPLTLINGVVTERGMLTPPYSSMSLLFGKDT